MTIVPYFLEDVQERKLPQGKMLVGKHEDEQIKTIVSDLDDLLRDERIHEKEKIKRKELSEVDVAIITILPEEYKAVLGHLENTYPAPATQEQPNLYAWEIGEVSSETYQQPYRVVLAMAGEPGSDRAVLTTLATIERWNPRYLLVVGIAGGLQAGKVAKGDVVVSDDIWNYEYGKYEAKYSPRQKYRYRSDTPIITAAQALEIKGAEWRAKLKIRHPERSGSLSLVVGPVASGDKVIDDLTSEFFQSVLRAEPKLIAVEMEGAGAGAAIKGALEKGRPAVGFAMIRGISDLPLAQAVAEAGVKPNQTSERDTWKSFAAEAAACFTVELIRGGWPVPPLENYR